MPADTIPTIWSRDLTAWDEHERAVAAVLGISVETLRAIGDNLADDGCLGEPDEALVLGSNDGSP